MNFDKRLIFQQTIPQNGLRAEKFGPLYLYVHSMPFNIFIFMFYIRLSFFCNTVLFRTEARQQHSWWLVSFDPWHRRRLVELMGKIFIMWKTEINEGFECQAKCKTTPTAFYKRIFFERNCFCHIELDVFHDVVLIPFSNNFQSQPVPNHKLTPHASQYGVLQSFYNLCVLWYWRSGCTGIKT